MITIDLNLIELEPGNRVLDIGCGSGRHTGAVYDHEKVLVVGGDKQPADLLDARERLELHDRLKTHQDGIWALGIMDINHLPFADESFDQVICSEVLEHLLQPGKAVHELYRVLKKDGIVAVSVPRYYPERICWLLSKEYRLSPGGHVRIFRYYELNHLLEQAGFKAFRSHFAHSLHTPYWWLKCLFGPSRADIGLIRLYERFLTWDMMQRPTFFQHVDRFLNPLMGKSIVIYAQKESRPMYFDFHQICI